MKLERYAYFGGRTEIFRYGYVGQQTYYMLDVNSMYPFSMIDKPMPVKLTSHKIEPTVNWLLNAIKSHYIIADVLLQTDENCFPLRLTTDNKLPFYLHNPHGKKYPDINNNRIIFPIGSYRTVLHQHELLYLIEHGKILKVYNASTYNTENLFDDYVEFFYNLKAEYKQANNLSWRFIVKLFLNSLYGKWGQLEPHRKYKGYNTEQRFAREPYYNTVDGVFGSHLTWDWRVYDEFKVGETTFSYPAIAGAITANARLYLYHLMTIARKERIYYCDTDSLITNVDGFNALRSYLSEREIGMLDVQKIGRRLVIRGNKDYRMDDKLVHKGISRNAKKTGKNEWRYIQFEGFVTSWKSGSISDMRGEYRHKGRRTNYNKAVIQDDNSFKPWVLAEDD